MTNKTESLQDKIARLRISFFSELPGRLDKIEGDLLCLKQSPNDVQVLNELHRKVHNIKGSAASFGLKDLSQLAIEVEKKLKHSLDDESSLSESVLADVQAVLQQMKLNVSEHLQLKATQLNEQSLPAFELPAKELDSESDEQTQIVYICEDDIALQQTLKIQLSCFAYSTQCFSSPEEMLDGIQKQVPDVIIMDIVFPDGAKTGIDCINKLHQLYEDKIPVIFVSARNDFEARLYAVQAGGSAYFTKPFNIMDLVDTLDNILMTKEPDPYRILVIDDDESVAKYHSLILEEAGMTVCTIHNAKTVLDVIFDFKPDLILMDMYMPVCNGNELALVIRQTPDFLTLPIVYLSSETNNKIQFSALKVGADGFLTKPINPERLISEVLLRTERMKILQSFMVRDSLTGLLNHTTVLSALNAAIISAKRRNEPLCFVMLDVDHFKLVNDVHGHAIGDQVLLALSRILKQRLRKSDFVGRYGGEEFAIVLPAVDIELAEKIVNELRDAFQNVSFNSKQGDFFCTLSGGITAFPDYDTVHDMVNSADSALYIAKTSGRNLIVRADQEQGKL